jgi:hypothetical protein
MLITTILELIKIGAEIFQDERKGSFLKKQLKLEKEYLDEMSKPDSERSDLTIDKLYFESSSLAQLLITEHYKK